MTAASIWMRLRSGEHLDLLHPDPNGWTDADLAYRLSRAEQLRELLHDAEEGLLGFDPLTPFKSHLGVVLGNVIAPLREAITLRYALPCWDEPTHCAHKWADRTAAASEAKHVVGWSDAEIVEMLGIVEAPLGRDPLQRPACFAAWEPWPASLDGTLFLNKLGELQWPAVIPLSLEADRPVHVLVTGGCEEIEGVIVGADGEHAVQIPPTMLVTVAADEGSLFKVNGWTCSTEVSP
jgi:hypothetical protein